MFVVAVPVQVALGFHIVVVVQIVVNVDISVSVISVGIFHICVVVHSIVEGARTWPIKDYVCQM